MKEIKKKETITKTYYKCDSCDSNLSDRGDIMSCAVCGNEICTNCSDKIDLFPVKPFLIDDSEDIWVNTDYEEDGAILSSKAVPIYLCKECSSKASSRESYVKAMHDLFSKVNEDILALDRKYLRGELD